MDKVDDPWKLWKPDVWYSVSQRRLIHLQQAERARRGYNHYPEKSKVNTPAGYAYSVYGSVKDPDFALLTTADARTGVGAHTLLEKPEKILATLYAIDEIGATVASRLEAYRWEPLIESPGILLEPKPRDLDMERDSWSWTRKSGEPIFRSVRKGDIHAIRWEPYQEDIHPELPKPQWFSGMCELYARATLGRYYQYVARNGFK